MRSFRRWYESPETGLPTIRRAAPRAVITGHTSCSACAAGQPCGIAALMKAMEKKEDGS